MFSPTLQKLMYCFKKVKSRGSSLPQWQVLLYHLDEPHAGIRAHVHGSQDRYDDKEPGGRTGWVHSLDHPVLLPRKKKQKGNLLQPITRLILERPPGLSKH